MNAHIANYEKSFDWTKEREKEIKLTSELNKVSINKVTKFNKHEPKLKRSTLVPSRALSLSGFVVHIYSLRTAPVSTLSFPMSHCLYVSVYR